MPHEEKTYTKRPKGGKGAGLTQRTKDIQQYGYSLEALDEAVRGFNQGGVPAPVSTPQEQPSGLMPQGQLPPQQGQSPSLPPGGTMVPPANIPPAIPKKLQTSGYKDKQRGYVSLDTINELKKLDKLQDYIDSGQIIPPKGDIKQPGRSFSENEYQNLSDLVRGSVVSGDGTFPAGAERWITKREYIGGTTGDRTDPDNWVEETKLSPESERLYTLWKAYSETRMNSEETRRLQQESQQTFLGQLLQNPSALAVYSLMGGGRGQFQGGGMNMPQGQLPRDPYGTHQKFGFQPYQSATATTSGYQSADTGNALTPEQLGLIRRSNNGQGFDQLEQSGAIIRSTKGAGTPVGGFFEGGVPRLGQLGTGEDATTALIGMLQAFGIDPEQLRQASAMATPGSVAGAGRARIALPGGSRR